jgi:hypothetical protein
MSYNSTSFKVGDRVRFLRDNHRGGGPRFGQEGDLATIYSTHSHNDYVQVIPDIQRSSLHHFAVYMDDLELVPQDKPTTYSVWQHISGTSTWTFVTRGKTREQADARAAELIEEKPEAHVQITPDAVSRSFIETKTVTTNVMKDVVR